jgi:hypothetical protein
MYRVWKAGGSGDNQSVVVPTRRQDEVKAEVKRRGCYIFILDLNPNLFRVETRETVVYNAAISEAFFSLITCRPSGGLAQLGEHYVRNVGVGGSTPLPSTRLILANHEPQQSRIIACHFRRQVAVCPIGTGMKHDLPS